MDNQFFDPAPAACRVSIAGVVRALCAASLSLSVLASARALEAAPARPAPSLPAPSGNVVNVATEPQLQAAVAWYHDHRDEIDAILRERAEEYERGVSEAVAA